MDDSSRQFFCSACQALVYICRRCDRGNIYCGTTCSQLIRRKYLSDANKRYRRSKRGRFNAALRQKKYREHQRNKKIVTHHGSPPSIQNDLLPTTPKKLDQNKKPELIQCNFCGCTCSKFVRVHFLKRNERYKVKQPLSWAQGP